MGTLMKQVQSRDTRKQRSARSGTHLGHEEEHEELLTHDPQRLVLPEVI